jgi:hypothetical protein
MRRGSQLRHTPTTSQRQPMGEPLPDPTQPPSDTAQPARLILDDHRWPMPQPGQLHGSPRRLRLYEFPFGGHVAVVSENGAGMSIVSIAEHVYTALHHQYPGFFRMVEHRPARPGVPEQIDEITLNATGEPRWCALADTELVGWIGHSIREQHPIVATAPNGDDTLHFGADRLSDDTVVHGWPTPDGHHVEIQDKQGRRLRLLPHHVRYSPAGFSWGVTGLGGLELSRSILIAVTGTDSQCRECNGRGLIAPRELHGCRVRCHTCAGFGLAPPYETQFETDFVARWPPEGHWRVSVGEVRSWLEFREWASQHPL